MRSPTARSLDQLRKFGAVAEVVEKWITIPGHPGGGKRKDLFDCIDIMAIQGQKLVGIQSTSGVNHNTRLLKAKASEKIAAFVRTGSLFEVWSWSKKGPRGEAKKWTLRVSQLSECKKTGKVIQTQ